MVIGLELFNEENKFLIFDFEPGVVIQLEEKLFQLADMMVF